jgi:formate dehydrogenase maturation protein FdhE
MEKEMIKIKSKRRSKYTEIKWDSFDVCPKCKSSQVNDVANYQDGKEHEDKNSYCLDCGTEWFSVRGKAFLVNWEYMN